MILCQTSAQELETGKDPVVIAVDLAVKKRVIEPLCYSYHREAHLSKYPVSRAARHSHSLLSNTENSEWITQFHFERYQNEA